ncbi:hypothetical protein HDU97_002144 [Phlyctochytrium planicorne]|nr:hypothetical protein HDU97_002144 [Phlyctochytrium planicorne]
MLLKLSFRNNFRAYNFNCFSADSIKDPIAGKNAVQRPPAECDAFYKSVPADAYSNKTSTSQGLSVGAISGIVAVCVAFLITGVLVMLFIRRSRQPKANTEKSIEAKKSGSLERNMEESPLYNVPASPDIPSVPVANEEKFLVSGHSALFHNMATGSSTPTVFPSSNDNDMVPFKKSSSDSKSLQQATIQKSAYNPDQRQGMGAIPSTISSTIADASKWTIEQVYEWLMSMDVGSRLADILKVNEVTGYHLLVITDEKLVQMGIDHEFSRQIILGVVDRLRGGNSLNASADNNAMAPPEYS